jgi:hypothetical protein
MLLSKQKGNIADRSAVPVEAKEEYDRLPLLRKGIRAPTLAPRCLALASPRRFAATPDSALQPCLTRANTYAQPNFALVDTSHGERVASRRSDI